MTSDPGSPEAAAQPTPAYLHGLNDPQREAVETLDGPLQVLAGAGTGKTRVLTTRIGHILVTRRAWPNQILAVTFTNKAAREMRDRVAAIIGGVSEGLWIGTFHAIATRVLRRHAELVGLQSNFTILDQDDQVCRSDFDPMAEGCQRNCVPVKDGCPLRKRCEYRGCEDQVKLEEQRLLRSRKLAVLDTWHPMAQLTGTAPARH